MASSNSTHILFKVYIYDIFIHIFKDNRLFRELKMSPEDIQKGILISTDPVSGCYLYNYNLFLNKLGLTLSSVLSVKDNRTSIK